jgi:hypothetical protein
MNAGVVILIAVAVLLVIALIAVAAFRRRSAGFSVRPLPANLVSAYEGRLPELERQFVSQPREAVASAKLLVDDMFHRMGYPVRMEARERAQDLRRHHRKIGERYSRAASLKADATTEQLRQSLQGYLEISRELLDEGNRGRESGSAAETSQRRELG